MLQVAIVGKQTLVLHPIALLDCIGKLHLPVLIALCHEVIAHVLLNVAQHLVCKQKLKVKDARSSVFCGLWIFRKIDNESRTG